MTLFLIVLLAALTFEYINGFHDTANAIATVVSTKVLSPRAAILWAAGWNLVGALAGTAVAKTISGGLVDAHAVNMVTVLAALLSAIVWGLITWWLGLPSSSSHALIGGLCGAALASAGNNWGVLRRQPIWLLALGLVLGLAACGGGGSSAALDPNAHTVKRNSCGICTIFTCHTNHTASFCPCL